MLDNNQTTTLVAETADMLAGLKWLKGSVGAKGTCPILEHVLFPGDGTMLATNLDQRATWRMHDGGRYSGHAPFTVSYTSLMKLLAGAGKGSLVHITPPVGRADKATVQVDGMTSKVPALPAEDFPTSLSREERISFGMTEAELAAALAFVLPCVSYAETRDYLRGVYMHPAKGRLSLVTTDGHKLAQNIMGYYWDGEWTEGVILPTNAAKAALAGLDKKSQGEVTVNIQKLGVTVSTNKWTLETRIIDGTFPDYHRVIPTKANHSVTLPVSDTSAALTRLCKLGETKGSALALDTLDQTMTLWDADGDEHSLPLKGARVLGEGLRQVFNSAYLKLAFETLGAAGAETVKVTTEDAVSAAKLTFGDFEGCWVVVSRRY